MKDRLLGKTLEELQQICKNLGLQRYVAKQLASWIYQKRLNDIDLMSNLSLNTRELIKEKYQIGFLPPIHYQISTDGTKKYLYQYGDNDYVEAVMIPDKERATICLSTQIGCRMNCSFCATAKQGFRRNLTAAEIVNLVLSLPEYKNLTNIVYMGMGEPFDNYDEVLKSLEIITSDWGLAMSPRRITVSTAGFEPKIKDFLKDSDAHLAISLHNPFHTQRAEIMPIEKSYLVEDIIQELKQYNWKGQRRVSFEYILWQNLNDSLAHVRELARMLDGLECRVNLIRFHTIPNTPFVSADEETMIGFRDGLNDRGITCTIRASKGEDILAACGLLSTKHLMQ